MDLAELLIAVTTLSTKIEAFASIAVYPSESSPWLQSQIKAVKRGLSRIQEWLHTAGPSNRHPIFPSLEDVFDVFDVTIEQLHLEFLSDTADNVNTGLSSLANGSSGLASSSVRVASSSLIERHSILLKDLVALSEFALAVCHRANAGDAYHEIRELAVGSRTFKETLTSTKRESQRLWNEQKSESEQYLSANYEAFIDAVLAADEDFTDGSASDTTVKRTASRASSLETDFSVIVDRSSRSFATPDVLHLPSASNGHANKPPPFFNRAPSSTKELEKSRLPVIIPYGNRSNARTTSHPIQTAPERPPKIAASASYSGILPVPPLKRKPIARQISAVNTSMVSLSSSSSSSAAEKAINIASEMTAQSPTRADPPGPGHVDYNLLSRRMSQQLSNVSSARTLMAYEKYQDSPPPYVSNAVQPAIPETVTTPVSPQPKRRETQSNTRTPFIINLVRENKIGTLRSLRREGMDIDEADPATGRTALMESALLRQQNILQILIQHGSRLHLKDTEGNTALHFAAAQGDAANCQTLIDAGAQVDEWNKRGETPLQTAALGGHTEAVVCLLQNWTSVKLDDPGLAKGFFQASKSGNISTAQAFLEKGMKPKKIKESWKPIAYAAQSGSIPMLDFMISQKFRLKDRSPDGWTALHFAARHGHPSMVERLLASKLSWKAQTKKTGETALHLAIAAGHNTTVETLMLHKDANVNMADSAGLEPIHHAVRNGDLTLTTALLNQGAKLSTQNKYGWKPIHIATAYGHLALVADFITRGVSYEEKLGSPSFKPSKHTNEAARKGFWAEIRWPHAGARPLHLALEFAQDEVANILIQGGAKLEEGDGEGWQPLHYAAFNCRIDLLHALLGKGASPHATTTDGNTPLSLGFRGPGLSATEEDKRHACEILQMAMNSHKKSKFKQLTSFMSANGKSRSAGERNKIWHTAELAAALYQEEVVEEGEVEAELYAAGSGGGGAMLESQEDLAENGESLGARRASK